MVEYLLSCWGKAQPTDLAAAPFHPLVYHCLDVAAVGEVLVEQTFLPLSAALAVFGSALDEERLKRQVGFLLALHDLGKLSRPFLAKQPDHWPSFIPDKMASSPLRHDAAGWFLFSRLLERGLPGAFPARAFPDWDSEDLQDFLAPVFSHHGRPTAIPRGSRPIDIFGSALETAGRDFLDLMAGLFRPDPILPPATASKIERARWGRASWPLAGLTVLADWIGSNQKWFPYHPPVLAPIDYQEQVARPKARDAVAAAGIGPTPPSRTTGYRELTHETCEPSPVQRWAETVVLPAGPMLALIEDMTGGGKTEAALILAHRLILEKRARGLYVALPTMATANGLYRRMAKVYRRLFEADADPSLALAHGATALHREFRDSVALAPDPARAAERDDAESAGGDGAGAACAAWLADSRRKTFLADVGVGTIDQALLAVLPAKYQSLRLLGLAGQVLIVDEAHAYDTYMGREIDRLLQFQAALGGSAIVLSATLPLGRRRALAEAFASGLEVPAPVLTETAYPLVAVVARNGATEEAQKPRPDLPRRLTVTRLADADEATARIAAAVRAGAAVAWVRNTVDDVFDAAERLRGQGIETTIFHARFAMGDRLAIEEEVVGRFGKNGNPAGRPGVLVASQVIEQSLDLDFDLLVSDLAPIDLLLQRAGRLWRHGRGPRPVSGPELLVVSPDPFGVVREDWYAAAFPGAAYVYPNPALLWLTAEALFQRAAWNIPEDVRALVEAVYGAEAEDRYPESLERRFNKAAGDQAAAGSIATSNLLNLERGYAGDHDGWDEDNRTPTRLGDATTVLRLARVMGRDIVPWCADDDSHRAWALSEVSVRTGRAAVEANPPPEMKAAVARAKATWTRHDTNKRLLVLTPDETGQWQGAVKDGRDTERRVGYALREGLRWRHTAV